MPYNKQELLKLPILEKQELTEALWNSIDDDLLPVTKEEIAFAQQRFNMHIANPDEGMSWSDLRKKIEEKYGF
jgi:putative addiction module component (TIGR02574 family)